MYTDSQPLGLGFSFSGLLTKAQTAVQKIQTAAKKVKESATQFLPPEAVQTIQTSAASVPAVPISDTAAASTSFLPSGLPVIPLVLLGGAAFFFLRRKKGRK